MGRLKNRLKRLYIILVRAMERFQTRTRRSSISIKNMRGDLVRSPIDPTITYTLLGARDSKLCVIGWIRTMLGMYYPGDVVNLLVQFYFESMRPFMSSASGTIDYDSRCLLREGAPSDSEEDEEDPENTRIRKSYFVSQIGWNNGRHQFNMKVGRLPSGSIAIGVVTNRDGFVSFQPDRSSRTGYANDWAFDSVSSGDSYQMYYDNGNKYRKWHYDGIFVHENGKRELNEKLKIEWNIGDIVGFQIDCDQQTLSFEINGETVGNILDLTESGMSKGLTYYPAIAFGGHDEAVLEHVAGDEEVKVMRTLRSGRRKVSIWDEV